jgi:hypothetical protein
MTANLQSVIPVRLLCALFLTLMLTVPTHAANVPAKLDCQTNAPIPWDQIGTKAGADYQGDGLSVTPTADGAQLRCVFQRLDGEATPDGLLLTSTVTNAVRDRFQVKAASVGRTKDFAVGGNDHTLETGNRVYRSENGDVSPQSKMLRSAGAISIAAHTVRFNRPVLTEEYSVSMDGVRQDFVVTDKPGGSGELRVNLAVSGAKVEQTAYGAQLVLAQSGRKIAYSRLHVTDVNGKELPAKFEVANTSTLRTPHSAFELVVVVNDTDSTYPVRIDPTFSDANWVSLNPSIPGTDGTVYAAVVDPSGNLYIGGGFTVAGGVIARNIAKWNGSDWSALGSGMNSEVFALALSGGTLYAGGNFSTAGGSTAIYIAQWSGSSWSALGSGMNGSVDALVVSGGTLYAGGSFTTAGSSAANRIAEWNGSSWSALGSGVNSTVQALAVSGSTLYAGGDFTNAGGSAVNYIAQWDGSGWSALGSGMNLGVKALAVSGGTLYAGGNFTNAGGSAANYIAQWNGGSWSALGSGMNGSVIALAVSGGKLYAGGTFTTAGGITASSIASWDGSTWSAMGSGMDNWVEALAVSGGTLYAGGNFMTADGSAANYIAQWNGSSWSALGSGMSSDVRALALSGSTLYAGGSFTTAGGVTANDVARWNGSSWSALGSGMNGQVVALAVSGNTLYAGGSFTTAGGVAANYVAQWNGSSWSALGSGVNNSVSALAVSGGTLYAGGFFTTAGGVTANYVAQWNGSSWSALGSGMSSGIGSGMDSAVHALAVSTGTLYAGGGFTNAGGVAANYIAQWNGTNWSALGSGMNSTVYALVASGSTLYAGGFFNTAGGVSAHRIAQWNGSSWSALGSGMNNTVFALAMSGSTLYAGGGFSTAGGVTANNVAQWNGSSWSALGSGLNSIVNALAVSGGTLCAGGTFTIAGGKVSGYTAEAVLPVFPPSISSQPTNQTVALNNNATFSVSSSGTLPLYYQWMANSSCAAGGTNSTLTVSNASFADIGNYLVVITNAYGSVTSSVATLALSGLPFTLLPSNGNFGLTNNQFMLALSGPAGSNVVISASTNLQTWTPLATNPLPLGSLMFTDTLATNFTQRFYRANLQ